MDLNKNHCHGSVQQQQQQQQSSQSSSSSQLSSDIVSKNNKSQLNNSSTGSYVNIVPVPIGIQYHRRKLTPQEYQSRLYYNNGGDYVRERNREEFYAITNSSTGGGGAGGIGATTNLSALLSNSNLSQQQQQQQHHQSQHQQSQHQSQHHQSHSQHQSQNQKLNDNIDSNLNNSRVAATQTSNCEQSQVPTPVPPPLLYTVHRVVTTAQIQTTVGNAFAASSSVSSVVSSIRSEADCIGGNNSNLGLNANSNYQQHQIINNGSNVSDLQSSSNSSHNYNPITSNSLKTSASIQRSLQNVIPTCVYLMSRIAVHMEIEGTAHCPSQVMLAAALGCEELGIANKLLAQSIFGLWMTSILLEIQLKSHHRPYVVRVAWPSLLEKFSQGNLIEKKYDEPMIVLKRNVFFSKKDEEKIKDYRILELLYEEAKHNVLTGRYIMEPVHSIMLGGIQARIELGPYNSHTHTVSFFRENQSRFLPTNVAKSSSWSWLPVSRKNSAEVKLMEQFKRVPQTATTRKLMRKYLEFCWALPFYGAAFFHGQLEQPVRGLMSLVNHKDISIMIAINERGIFIIDPIESTLLLGLKYEDFSWDYAKPSTNDDPDCQTCIFIQFDAVENGIAVSKLMQIFSRQAAMMDTLISHFANQMRRKREENDGQSVEQEEPNPIQNNGNGVLSNKLSRLTLATYDDEGRCIGQMGSLSISY